MKLPVVALAVLVIGGAGAWYFLGQGAPEPAPAVVCTDDEALKLLDGLTRKSLELATSAKPEHVAAIKTFMDFKAKEAPSIAGIVAACGPLKGALAALETP